MRDEFRVEVELQDADDGYSLGERLRARGLDDDVRERLGQGAIVTRDGSRLFLYTASESDARAAAEVVRDCVAADGLAAEIAITRWHEVEEAWKDASLPLPATPAERGAETAALEAREAEEALAEGRFDWEVMVRLDGRHEAAELAERLTVEGYAVRRRWRYVSVGVTTAERAEELAARLRAELPEYVEVHVEVDLSDVARSPLLFAPLQFLPF